MKIGEFDIHMACVDEFINEYDEISKHTKSKEQSDFESLILGNKHLGSTTTEEWTKDDENFSINTVGFSLKNDMKSTPPRKTFPFSSNMSVKKET